MKAITQKLQVYGFRQTTSKFKIDFEVKNQLTLFWIFIIGHNIIHLEIISIKLMR